MPQIDSITALGRLLQNGALRDAYVGEPERTIEKLDVVEVERNSLLGLNIADLEIQAQVLLRKRYENVAPLMPQTCSGLVGSGWPLFAEFARSRWPDGEDAAVMDAEEFCKYLTVERGIAISRSERKRIRFCRGSKKMSVNLAKDVIVRGRRRSGIQVFFRRNRATWSEYVIYFALS